jgi:hypothetical protein
VLYRLSYVGSITLLSAAPARASGVGSGGFEPPKLAHLIYSQAQLSTLATAHSPAARVSASRADDGTRTRNLLFTKQLLCQLSYVGKPDAAKRCAIGQYTNRTKPESTREGTVPRQLISE